MVTVRERVRIFTPELQLSTRTGQGYNSASEAKARVGRPRPSSHKCSLHLPTIAVNPAKLQVVGKAASIAMQTWMRNNDKTKARAEEREKNIGWIKRLFTAWRVSHTERTKRRAERKEAGEDDSEEDEPVEIPLSAVTDDAPEGDPSANIICGSTSVRRESGPEQQHDL